MTVHKPTYSRHEDLQRLVDNKVVEKSTLDYKIALDVRADSERKEFLRDVSSFANTGGGHIVYGMRESAGIPVELIGVTLQNTDAEILRLESIVSDGVRPRITGINMIAAPLPNGNHALVIHIPSSWARPHMVTFKNDGKFFARHSNGKYQMDVDQLRVAFSWASTIEERSVAFRDSRIEAIAKGQLPSQRSKRPLFILHALPYSTLTDARFIDLSAAEKNESVHALHGIPSNSFDAGLKYSLTGLQFYRTDSSDCVTVFRDGKIEIVEGLPIVSQPNGTQAINESPAESGIAKRVTQVLDAQRALGIEPPLAIFLSFTNVRGKNLNITTINNPWGNGRPIEEDSLLIPGTRADSFDSNPHLILRPLFDGLWLAAGWPKSMDYDETGSWLPWHARRQN